MIKKSDLQKYRHNFNHYLIQNPNYFGNIPTLASSFSAIVALKGNTRYEELSCVSFNPETNELRAVVTIKKGSGYSGSSCGEGSLEYVRFFVDYKRNGDWVDEGITHFNAHDLQFETELCYGVKLPLSSKYHRCCDNKPILPRVRAVLSWNQQPPADEPNWSPVWGNTVEANIQLAPRNSLFCLDLIPHLRASNITLPHSVLKQLAGMKVFQKEKAVAFPAVDLAKLKKSYAGKVEDARLGFKAVQGLMAESVQPALIHSVKDLKRIGLDFKSIIKVIKKPDFNTAYEELKCVALNRQMSVLHGAIHIKRNAGYSGSLCEQGSREYIAFYMNFGAGWKYMGTTSVAVHDIALPKGGLWYNAALPISLTSHQQKWCETGKAKVRGILSWNALPAPHNPDYVAVWGDWEECHVEVKPLPKGVSPGITVPVIDLLGGMPVGLIAANGEATGAHTTAGFVTDAPFDGRIKIQGMIANAPDSSHPLINRLNYRIMMKTPSFATHQPLYSSFEIRTRRLNGAILSPQSSTTLTPKPDGGWVEYYPDYMGADLTWEIENLLGEYRPSESGLHDMYIEVLNPATSSIISSNRVKFMVDTTPVVVDIEIDDNDDSGNCGTYIVEDILTGTFSIKDEYCASMSLSVTPIDEAKGAKPLTIVNPATVETYPVGYSSLTYNAPSGALSGTGIVAGKWTLNTKGMAACGYNIRIKGRERTIINSHSTSRGAQDIEGFCLKAK